MTNPVVSFEPGPGGTCRVCASQLPAGSLHCTTCGATYGESNRCPHCRSIADVEPSEPLRFRCRVCGGPRVPVDDAAVVRSGREQSVLASAGRARIRAATFRVGAGVLAGFAVLSLLVAIAVMLIAWPGTIGALGMFVTVSVPFVMALMAFRRSKRSQRELAELLQRAWALVASDVLRSRGHELRAADLARSMRLDEAEAERLLAELNVNDFIHARVTADGDVAYSTRELPRVRVPGTEVGATLLDPEADPPLRTELTERDQR